MVELIFFLRFIKGVQKGTCLELAVTVKRMLCLNSDKCGSDDKSVLEMLNFKNNSTLTYTYNLENADVCSKKCVLTNSRLKIYQKKTILENEIRFPCGYNRWHIFFAMFEHAVISILREHKADYGLQRIYATIGGMISSPLSGWMIDFASKGKGFTDFSGVLMLFINLEFKKAAASVVLDVIRVLRKLELIALFISCLILGCAWGFIESFLFWLLEDLGGSKSLMGLTITVGGIIGIPLLVLSGPIVKKLGHANVIFLGFVFYAIRLLAMESITFGLSFTAAVIYAAKLSTVTTDTSIEGMLGRLYYGVGKGVGSLIGGYLIKPIDIRHTFQEFSITTLIIGLIYFAFYHSYIKHRSSKYQQNGLNTTSESMYGY
ncbi:hypothetical protein ABEB36_010642 [Hypothenemus hampei]|uniref:Major facilitator superfamily associated domain-containing protein n=1 Tax=Hypothenemus hampei TaxID=57062 RepID=A0ABD1ECQ2_HYPHA